MRSTSSEWLLRLAAIIARLLTREAQLFLMTTTPVTEPSVRRRGLLSLSVVLGSLVVTALLVFHAQVPDVGGIGLILDTGLPWVGLAIPVLALIALAARRGRPVVATLLPAVVWVAMFVPQAIPLEWSAPAPSDSTLSVASQNVQAEAGTAAESASTLAATGADVIALQELPGSSRDEVKAVLAESYEYSYVIGTVGLWSKYPILHAQPLGLGLSWNRALAADLDTPSGLVSIYVVHADSARPGDHDARDTMLTALAQVLPNDENERVIVVGDFNAASTDRHFAQVAAEVGEPNHNGGLWGFTWPSAPIPLTRLDHFLQRGMEVTSHTVMPAGDSDHLAILASVNL